MSPTLEVVSAYSSNEVAEPRPQSGTSFVRRKSVCIVVPIWNKSEQCDLLTFKALQSIQSHVDEKKIDVEVVLVDNASPVKGDWRAILRRDLNMDVDVVALKENWGFGPAVNLGFQLYPKSDYVCQMNSDCELVEDSVNILVDVIERNNLAASMPEHYENCAHYGLDKSQDLMGQDWRFGAFWVMKREWWDLVGGFDPTFEMCYWEDSDLWRRVEAEGGKIAGWRGTWVKHVGNASSLPDMSTWFEKNRLLYEKKWGGR